MCKPSLTIEDIDNCINSCFCSDKNSLEIIEAATKKGYIRRISHSQAEWSDEGLEKAKNELPTSQPIDLAYNSDKLRKALKREYKMEAIVHPYGQDVTFLGTELECYKMAYKCKAIENKVAYSKYLEEWYVSFPYWFNVGFAQKIKS